MRHIGAIWYRIWHLITSIFGVVLYDLPKSSTFPQGAWKLLESVVTILQSVCQSWKFRTPLTRNAICCSLGWNIQIIAVSRTVAQKLILINQFFSLFIGSCVVAELSPYIETSYLPHIQFWFGIYTEFARWCHKPRATTHVEEWQLVSHESAQGTHVPMLKTDLLSLSLYVHNSHGWSTRTSTWMCGN